MCKLLYEGVERYIVGVHTLVAEGTMVFLRVTLYIEEMDTRGAQLLINTRCPLVLHLLLQNFLHPRFVVVQFGTQNAFKMFNLERCAFLSGNNNVSTG